MTAPTAGGQTTSRPTARRTGPGLLLWAAAVLLVLTVAVVIALIQPRSQDDRHPYDPDSTRANGTRALAAVLDDRGVRVTREDRWAAVQRGPRARTLVVTDPSRLSDPEVAALSGQAEHVVLVRPDSYTLDVFGLSLAEVSGARTRSAGGAPGCELPAAVNAGDTPLTGSAYRRVDGLDSSGVTLCHQAMDATGKPDTNTGFIVRWEHDGTRFTALGSADVLVNNAIAAERGRAALGLWVLGENRELTWWVVDPADPLFATDLAEPQDTTGLLPSWVSQVIWWLLVVTVLAAVWRGRRLGSLVPEPLPVIVRSAETAIGRAALYRQIRARDRAADLIRARTLQRLRPLLGLGPRTDLAEVVAATTAAAPQWPPARIHRLLNPGPVPDDTTLLAIATDADQLLAGLSWLSPHPAPDRKGQP